MSIVTKKGDSGQTSLYSGERVWKDDLRVEAYGTLDELVSFIANAKHYIDNKEIHSILSKIQHDLLQIIIELATPSKTLNKTITKKEITFLSKIIKESEKEVQLKGFVQIGILPSSAQLDICRTVTRRAERIIVSLSKVENVSPYILQYINRLSDLFFILARRLEKQANALVYIEKDKQT